MKKNYLFLLLVFVFGLIIYFYQLANFPPTPTRDEVSVAYNALSIAQTGKDEHGIPYPSSFLAFGDQKIPFYTYLTAGLFKFVKPSITTTRLPSAIFGALSILAVYFFVQTLYQGKKPKLALTSAALFTITPWHIFYSRMVYEANVELFLLLITIALLIKGWRENYRFLFYSLIPTNIALYTYNSTIFLLPFVLILTFFIFRKNKKLNKQIVFYLVLVGLSYFTYTRIFSAGNAARKRATIFDIPRVEHTITSNLADMTPLKPIFSRMVHNKPIAFFNQWIRNFTYTIFNPDFLYFYGDNHPWHKSYGLGRGNLYFLSFPFFLLGAYVLIKNGKKGWFILILWLISPLASSFTWDTPLTTRLLLYLTLHTIIAANGILYAVSLVKKTKLRRAVSAVVGVLYIYFLVAFIADYIWLFPKNLHPNWLDGFPELVLATNKVSLETKPDKIFVDATEDQELSYIYFAWYTPFPPAELQKNAVWTSTIFQRVGNFDNYYFYNLEHIKNDPEFIKEGEKYLYAGPWNKRPSNKVLKIVDHAKSYPMWAVVEFTKEDL
jgi:hypothetical protein